MYRERQRKEKIEVLTKHDNGERKKRKIKIIGVGKKLKEE
jgi:hypothetical protein